MSDKYLELARECFEKYKSDDTLDQHQKNYHYALLMSDLETHYSINLVGLNDDKDPKMMKLYRDIANERDFNIYE